MTNNFLARDNSFVLRQFDMNTHIHIHTHKCTLLLCVNVSKCCLLVIRCVREQRGEGQESWLIGDKRGWVSLKLVSAKGIH